MPIVLIKILTTLIIVLIVQACSESKENAKQTNEPVKNHQVIDENEPEKLEKLEFYLEREMYGNRPLNRKDSVQDANPLPYSD